MILVHPEAMASDAPPEPAGMTIDELAAAARVPTRTIRFYQARGALQRPEIRGRVAYYGPAHLERLELIARLQDRGLRIAAIRDLVSSIDRGEVDLHQWLGVEQQVGAPWTDDPARTVDEAGLYELAGTRRPALIADLVRAGLARREGDVYLVPSPRLLQIAMKLEAGGIDLDTATAAAEIVDKHLARAAEQCVELFVRRIRDGALDISDPEATFPALRPLGTEAVKLMFARAMDRELRKLIASGGLRALRRPGRRRRR